MAELQLLRQTAAEMGLQGQDAMLLVIIIIIIIIIIIKKGWQCKAGRERLTPYQSEDPNLTTPNHRLKEEKGTTAVDKM